MIKPLHLFWIPLFLIALMLPGKAYSQQQSCSYTLKEAQRLYQQGLIKDIPSMLQGCLEKGFTRRERQDAYKLILLCYLYDDNQTSADSAMPNFLKKFPDYEINPTDPKEFVYLFNSYRNLPVLSVGLTFGLNLSQVSLIESYQMANTNGTARKYKGGSFGSHYGIQLNTYITSKIEIGLGFLIANNKFSSIDSIKFLSSTTQLLSAAESESRYEFPVFGRYNFKSLKKFIPYARIGVVPAYTTGTTITLGRNFIGKSVNTDLPPISYDIMGWRKQFGVWALAGAGVKWELPPAGYAWLDIKYQLGITPMKVNADAQYAATDIGSKYYYRSDNFSISNLGVSVGFSYSFYKPTKKQARQ